MEIKKVPISDVDVWEKNPRNIKTKDMERLKRQIKELGVYKPLICVQENGRFITLGGNMRLRALQSLGIGEIDISIVKAPDEATRIKFALSDNDRAGEYDEQQLAELVYPHIEEINLEDFKVDLGEAVDMKSVIDDYGPSDESEDEVPEIDDSPAITKLGDLFTLGRHRLLCGDATKEADVARLMDGKKVDMVFTDPPYGMDLDTDFSGMVNDLKFAQEKNVKAGKKYPEVTGDSEEFNPTFLLDKFGDTKEMFLWGADYYSKYLPRGSWLVWDKRLEEKADRMYGSCFELCWSKKQHRREIIRFKWAGIFGTEQEFDHKRYHPTQKPIGLSEWFLRNYGDEQQRVIDLFVGAGGIFIACEKLNRICYGMEIEPKYIDVIITRYCNYTDTPEEEIRATVEHG